jgi:hypothetical protein
MIVGMIPTYKEGKLASDAINSILSICKVVLVFEGPISGAPSDGIPSDFAPFKKNQKVVIKHGEWSSEIAKRNSMLQFTRRYPPPVWGLYLDADEVLLWPEYIGSYIESCEAQAPEGEVNVVCPILRVELDGSVQSIKRIIRLDMLEAHILSMSQWKFYGSDLIVTFPSIPEERKPNQGEPHIFHRAFLRPPKRGGFRLYEKEIEDFTLLETEARKALGISDLPPAGAIPIQKDGVFVPLTSEDKNVSPHSPLLEIPSASEIARSTKKK